MTARALFRILSLATALSVAAPLSADATPSALVQKSGPVEVGKPLPGFAGWTLDGKPLSFERLLRRTGDRPTAVVVSVFATWCESCREHLPAIQQAVSTVPGARALLVSYGPEDEQAVETLVTDLKLTAPVILDRYATACARLGVTRALPRTFVVDGNGVVVAIFESEGDDFPAQIVEALVVATRSSAEAPASGSPFTDAR